jgi:hypothetical protein
VACGPHLSEVYMCYLPSYLHPYYHLRMEMRTYRRRDAIGTELQPVAINDQPATRPPDHHGWRILTTSEHEGPVKLVATQTNFSKEGRDFRSGRAFSDGDVFLSLHFLWRNLQIPQGRTWKDISARQVVIRNSASLSLPITIWALILPTSKHRPA